jgi:hypothetical protein
MSPSAQLISEQLKEIIEDEKKTDKGAREVQEQVDGEENLDLDNTSSVLNTVLNTINNEFEHECLDEAVRLLNAHPIRQSPDDRVPGHKYSIPGLPGIKFLAHQVWAIWFIVRRWVWDTDMPRALVADEMGLGKTFTLVAAVVLATGPDSRVGSGFGSTRHRTVATGLTTRKTWTVGNGAVLPQKPGISSPQFSLQLSI